MTPYSYPKSLNSDGYIVSTIKFAAYYPVGILSSGTSTSSSSSSTSTSSDYIGTVEFALQNGASMADGVNYNEANLGALAGTISDKIQKMKEEGKQIKIANLVETGDMISIGIQGAIKKVASQNIRDAVMLTARTVQNPHTNMLFKDVKVRTSAFEFNMVASSSEEAEEILNIINFFRQHTYPELDDGTRLLKFPPLWDIVYNYNGQENKFLPKIHKSFLQSVDAKYNQKGGNSWHSDGAPIDVTLGLSFTESKTYSKNTILEGDSDTTGTDIASTSSNEDGTSNVATAEDINKYTLTEDETAYFQDNKIIKFNSKTGVITNLTDDA